VLTARTLVRHHAANDGSIKRRKIFPFIDHRFPEPTLAATTQSHNSGAGAVCRLAWRLGDHVLNLTCEVQSCRDAPSRFATQEVFSTPSQLNHRSNRADSDAQLYRVRRHVSLVHFSLATRDQGSLLLNCGINRVHFLAQLRQQLLPLVPIAIKI